MNRSILPPPMPTVDATVTTEEDPELAAILRVFAEVETEYSTQPTRENKRRLLRISQRLYKYLSEE